MRCFTRIGLPVHLGVVLGPAGRGDDVCCSCPFSGQLCCRAARAGADDLAPRSRRARDAPDKQKTPRVREVCATRSARRASR